MLYYYINNRFINVNNSLKIIKVSLDFYFYTLFYYS
jgi:hypothetical protein